MAPQILLVAWDGHGMECHSSVMAAFSPNSLDEVDAHFVLLGERIPSN